MKKQKVLFNLRRHDSGCDGKYCLGCPELLKFKSIESFANWGNAGSYVKKKWNIRKLEEAGFPVKIKY
jgi:hypothetical protein